MSILLLTADLACSSQAAGAAARVGVQVEVTMSVPRLLDRARETGPRLVIVDLNMPGLDCGELVGQLQRLPEPPRTIAFGPHVHATKLDAAREAGCNTVLSRGEFYARLAELLVER